MARSRFALGKWAAFILRASVLCDNLWLLLVGLGLLPAIVEARGFLAGEVRSASEWFLAGEVRSGLAEALVRSKGSLLPSLLP